MIQNPVTTILSYVLWIYSVACLIPSILPYIIAEQLDFVIGGFIYLFIFKESFASFYSDYLLAFHIVHNISDLMAYNSVITFVNSLSRVAVFTPRPPF